MGCVYGESVEKYDIVNVTGFVVEEGSEKVVIVKAARRIFTGVAVRLGLPAKYDAENVNAPNISPVIPKDAKLVLTSSLAKSRYKPLSALSLYERGWTVKVRLINRGPKRELKNSKGFYMISLEFVDEEGTAISAILSGEAVEKYDKILEKGKVYMVSNGEVKIAVKKYSSVNNDYSLKLDASSLIEEVEDDRNIKQNEFNFTPIKNLFDFPEAAIVDVLGVVTVAGSKQLHIAKRTKDGFTSASQEEDKTYKRFVTLADESGSAISLSLWGRFAETDLSAGAIVGCKRVKIIVYGEKQLTSIASTEIVANPQVPRTPVLRGMVEDKSIFNSRLISKGSKHIVIIRVRVNIKG